MLTLERVACRLRVVGLVQGVGFRPYVHQLATSMGLCGWICNDAAGVVIHLEGELQAVETFRACLPRNPPAAAQIESVTQEPVELEAIVDFRIRFAPSSLPTSLQARVPADRAICALCRDEILDPENRRHRHAFATCTECGPRYSIVHSIPYERHSTSLRGFPMCSACREEYEDPANRRFHAEPIACPDCGPRLTFFDPATPTLGAEWPALLAAAETLRAGKIVAMKGLGGYQLLVRADDNDAVQRLRQRKHRPAKPFAVMVRSIEQAERFAQLSPVERAFLQSPENPIVLLQMKARLCDAVAPHLPLVGLMLPTTPLHVLLLSLVDFPIVATSGNQSDEPIVIDETRREALADIADAFLDHDRPIVRRVDDSVIRVIDDEPMMIRLARGHAPCTLPALERWAAKSGLAIPPMLAVGGQQKTAVALWTGSQAILAPHLGDTDHPEARRVFADTVADLASLYRCEPKVLVGDLHPDYHTTRWAQAAGKPFLQVQHHHAHAVACMAEHDLLEREVLAIIWDGTGLGADGTFWGGEILQASMQDFQRLATLDSFALPGGEAAIHEPNRIALALLAAAYAPAGVPGWLIQQIGFTSTQACGLIQMIERRVNAPRTSSVGRLFDGVAALILGIREVSFEGEAAMRLEAAVDPEDDTAYPLPVHIDADGLGRGDWRPLIAGIVEDIGGGVAKVICAARFHNALAHWAAAVVASSPLPDVVLGGGCFQNAWLTRRARAAIVKQGKTVHLPGRVPPNDGGLAVGQLAIGMARWRRLLKEQ